MNTDHSFNDAKALWKRGINQMKNGKNQEAIQDFNQALQLHSDNAEIYGYRCVAHYRLGNRQRAIEDCQQAAKFYWEQGKEKEYHYSLKMLEKLSKQETL